MNVSSPPLEGSIEIKLHHITHLSQNFPLLSFVSYDLPFLPVYLHLYLYIWLMLLLQRRTDDALRGFDKDRTVEVDDAGICTHSLLIRSSDP